MVVNQVVIDGGDNIARYRAGVHSGYIMNLFVVLY
jgi:hypothetical protein